MKFRPEYDIKQIGQNLKYLREAKNLTVDEVRRYLRLSSVQAIYKYETGKSYPPTDTMFALMQLYEADLFDVICGREKRPDIIYVNVIKEQRLRRLEGYLKLYLEYRYGKAG